jgi:hypothetical protein
MPFAALLLAACAADPALSPVDQAAPPVLLTVSQLSPGQPTTFTVTGANPGDLVLVGRGSDVGFFGCPPTLFGGCVLLQDPELLFTEVADATGTWSWTGTAPAGLRPGSSFAFQAFALGTTGIGSNPITVTVVDPAGETDCLDGVDGDFDGLADCLDTDCAATCDALCDLGSCCYTDADTLAVPGSVSGALDATDALGGPGGPNRYFDDLEFTGAAGQVLTLSLDSTIPAQVHLQNGDCDTIGLIEAPNGSFVTPITLPYDGTYTLVVSSLNPGETGPYTLQLDDPTVVPPGPGERCFADDTVVPLPWDDLGTLDGTDALVDGRVADDLEVTLFAGDILDLRLDAEFPATVSLYDAACVQVATVDLPGGDGHLVHPIATSGAYTATIAATTGLRGDYRYDLDTFAAAPLGERCLFDVIQLVVPGTTSGDLDLGDETGLVQPGAIYDDIEFQAVGGTEYQLTVTANEDLDVVLLDDTCQTVATFDAVNGLLSTVVVPPSSGIYTVGLSAQSPFTTASYTLGIEAYEEPPPCVLGSCCFGDTLTLDPLPESYLGDLSSGDDPNAPFPGSAYFDDIEFEGVAGSEVAISVSGTGVDAIHLYDASCQELGSFPVVDSFDITLPVPADGVYTVAVSGVGSYTLAVDDLGPPPPACVLGECCLTDTETVEVGDSIAGTLDTTDDFNGPRSGAYYDDYEIALTAGQTILIEMQSTQLDSYLYVQDQGCTNVAADDDGGAFSYDSFEAFTAPVDGIYTIVATSYSGADTGNYTLTID